MTKYLFLVDDEKRGFWTGKNEWNEPIWESLGWSLNFIDGTNVQDEPGSLVTIFANIILCEVLRLKISEFYVVTDGHFGTNHIGGGQLLKYLSKQEKGLSRGIVYSSDPRLPNDLPSDKFICMNRDDNPNNADVIRLFLESGKISSEAVLLQDVTEISSTIHALDNMLLPIKLDIETLTQVSDHADIAKEIYTDYFSPKDGYLVGHCRKHDNLDIINIFESKLNMLGSVARNDPTLTRMRLDLLEIITSLRESQENIAFGALRDILNNVLKKGTAIVDRLRELRAINKVSAS